MKMAGREVFKAAVLAMAEACDEALTRAGVTADQIDLLIPHQANLRIIEATAKHAGIPMDKVMVNVDRYGNTSSASIPLALDQAVAEGRVGPGLAPPAGRVRRRVHLGERRRPVVTVLMCPGQGAQRVGMGKDLAERFPVARDTFAAIDEALGVPLSRIMWEGPEDELTLTHNAQPAILAHSAAVLAVVAERLGTVAAGAGHSLGEYSAHVAAGTLTVADAARLVRRRGELMLEAGQARPGRDGRGARPGDRRGRGRLRRGLGRTAAWRSPPTSTRPTRPSSPATPPRSPPPATAARRAAPSGWCRSR